MALEMQPKLICGVGSQIPSCGCCHQVTGLRSRKILSSRKIRCQGFPFHLKKNRLAQPFYPQQELNHLTSPCLGWFLFWMHGRIIGHRGRSLLPALALSGLPKIIPPPPPPHLWWELLLICTLAFPGSTAFSCQRGAVLKSQGMSLFI